MSLCVLGLLATAAPAAAFDLTVQNVEVTQAIQTPSNSIELVGGRSTAVRATIANVGGPDAPGPISGRLHVFQNGAELTPPAGLPALNQPFTLPAAPDRAKENDTLNFELPAPTGLGFSDDVDFRVDIDHQGRDTNAANDSGFASNLKSRNRAFPRIYFVRVNYTQAGLGLPPMSYVRPGTGDAFICGIFPVDDSQPDFYRKAPLPSLTFSFDENGNNLINGSPDGSELLSLLASQRQLLVEDGLGASDLTYLYGWIAGNPTTGNGKGQLPGHVAWGNSEPNRGQRTFAHEVTHNFGLDHVNRTLNPEVGWDVGAQLDANPADNGTTGRVKPQPRNDIQVAGQLTPTAWIDTIDYQYLLNHPSFSPEDPFAKIKNLAKTKMLVVKGRVDPLAGKLVELEPSYRYPWASQSTPPPASMAQLQVQVKTMDGKVMKVNAAATEGDDMEVMPHTEQGHFEAMVPVTGRVESVKVVSRGRRMLGSAQVVKKRTIGTRLRSKGKPKLTMIDPVNPSLEGMEKIDWTVEDADTKTSKIEYQAAYSPDGGKSFVPIGVALKRSKLTFDTSELPPSDGQGLIRVFASDGLNSTYKDLKGLSVASLPGLAPTACQDP